MGRSPSPLPLEINNPNCAVGAKAILPWCGNSAPHPLTCDRDGLGRCRVACGDGWRLCRRWRYWLAGRVVRWYRGTGTSGLVGGGWSACLVSRRALGGDKVVRLSHWGRRGGVGGVRADKYAIMSKSSEPHVTITATVKGVEAEVILRNCNCAGISIACEQPRVLQVERLHGLPWGRRRRVGNLLVEFASHGDCVPYNSTISISCPARYGYTKLSVRPFDDSVLCRLAPSHFVPPSLPHKSRGWRQQTARSPFRSTWLGVGGDRAGRVDRGARQQGAAAHAGQAELAQGACLHPRHAGRGRAAGRKSNRQTEGRYSGSRRASCDCPTIHSW